MTTPNDPMAEIRASFFMECEELLEALQDGLDLLESETADAETINVVFRAVHSIKGGAGAFGLDPLVRFSHGFETVLDAVRSGKLHVDAGALNVFFQASDHLCDLVRACRDDAALPDTRSAEVQDSLNALLGADTLPQDADEEEIEFQPLGISLDLSLDDREEGAPDNLQDLTELSDLPDLPDLSEPTADNSAASATTTRYYISFKPLDELFETGNEPVVLLRNLQALGTMEVQCDASDLPSLDKLVPETTYLKWLITLDTAVEQAEISSVFEFVEGLCTLDISVDPPQMMGEATVSEITDTPCRSQPPAPTQTPRAPATANTAVPPANTMVRVDLVRIERLVNLVGELVINQAMLSQSLESAGLSPHSDAMNGLEEFQRLTRDIQDSVMMIRAQPVKTLFQRMSRIVREASAAVDKDARLITEGENTEVDKTVIERLADPLTHMIRNAVDHGLETTECRLAFGKPAQGKVTLSAAHRSGRVVIEVRDDGSGINRDKVRQIAIDKGLIPEDAQLSDGEIDNLLFLPGFSTASEVSDLSGRGVGMDVVRTDIQSLGGRVTISSEEGQGTSISISLPLTLAVLDGMVVEVAAETLVLPLNLVIETITLEKNDVQMLRPDRMVVRVRDGFAPLIDLGYELGYRPQLDAFEGSVVLLIAHEDGSRAAVLIDGILDQRQVVIKGLDDNFYRAPGIAAATILGDGQIALILDPSDIITQALSANDPSRRATPEGMAV